MLPNLIIIGAMKAATSSLHYYLDLHPDVSMAQDKELDFFVESKNWRKGLGWYEGCFAENTPWRGESSPNYTKYPRFKGVPERMRAALPEVKLIYLVRDPVERIVSQYVHAYAAGRESRPFEQVVADPASCYPVFYSQYYMQLSQYLACFDADDILVVCMEDLQKQRQLVLQHVFRFLGIDPSFYAPEYSTIVHQSSDKRRRTSVGRLLDRVVSHSTVKPWAPPPLVQAVDAFNARTGRKVAKPTMDAQTRQRLVDYLKDDVARLRAHTGQQFPDWCL